MYATDTSLTGPAGGTLVTQRAAILAAAEGITPDNRQVPVQIPAQQPSCNDRSWPLLHRPEAVADARHRTQAILEHWHVAEDITDVVLLVVSELVTNAVEHALAPVVLHLHRERAEHRIWIGVTDGGPAPRDGAWTRSCSHDEHGRGLDLVKALCEAHGTCAHTNGHSTHWARVAPTAA
ncbi:ATP-binding protein [Streptomyces sp. SKN60]|uniref:ATP-binding protein n=1 Tax=Streptomyces sp. SKN60 TaxID=2855506 RepID=UPI0022455DFE|nr:ATP-binding protein [Streptomyces sp. SKN60]MCX2185034.1 ATP-binding protein [Streptomyces sp. SKN60]